MGRKDGKRAKNVDMMYTLASYVMDKRNDATNAVTVRVPFEPMRRYAVEKRKEGENISYMSLVIAAYLRAACKYPFLNRFVVNKRVYCRNELWVAMVVKRADEAEHTMTKIRFEMTDTVLDVNRKIMEFLERNRDEDANSTDALMRNLLKFPALASVLVGFLKWLDKHGFWPKALIDASPFHSSMSISNLASIRMNHIYHHIYNFGTTSLFITMGNMEDIPKNSPEGIILEKHLPLGIVCDERVCSGEYYTRAFHEMQTLLKNPEKLELPPDEVLKDW